MRTIKWQLEIAATQSWVIYGAYQLWMLWFYDYLPARREGPRDRAHVQLIEVPSGCIMVLSLTKRLYLIDVHFVPIASFAYKEQTAKDELACEEEYRKNNLCTNRMDSCAWWTVQCVWKNKSKRKVLWYIFIGYIQLFPFVSSRVLSKDLIRLQS